MTGPQTATLTIDLPDPRATARLAQTLAPALRPGDCLLLSGSIGAGKTHFARALIQNLLTMPEDVPSPTYTLVQTYDSQCGEIWHADLYRLTSVSEIEELGLLEAFDTAITVIEWPDRLGELAPDTALTLDLIPDPQHEDRRTVRLTWRAEKWFARMESLKHDDGKVPSG